MKVAICVITLFLLFLIRFVNNYMLRRKQKEFAVQSIMGMEQKTVGRLFFAETFVMGMISIAIGIFLGVFCSQFITAMLLTSYGKSYELTWTLFPDTVLLTIGFFVFSFLVVGLFNTRTIRKTKIIDMLAADRDAKVVFIGPCAAKKLEAMRRTVRSDVDFVVTFEELQAMFDAKDIDLTQYSAESSFHNATGAGRGYAVAGGVADAIRKCINTYYPGLACIYVNAFAISWE